MTTENTEELETLHQVSGMLTPLQKKVEHEVRKVGFKAKSKPRYIMQLQLNSYKNTNAACYDLRLAMGKS